MRIISRRTLQTFWVKHPDAQGPLEAWHAEAKAAKWSNPAEIKTRYPSASILNENRVVFNIGGNKYRLVVWIRYEFGLIYVRFVGTHAEYDKIDAEVV
jgi:mRNA interferase HigB